MDRLVEERVLLLGNSSLRQTWPHLRLKSDAGPMSLLSPAVDATVAAPQSDLPPRRPWRDEGRGMEGAGELEDVDVRVVDAAGKGNDVRYTRIIITVAGPGGEIVLMGDSVVSQVVFFFFQAEDGIRDVAVTGVQTCALPISICREAPVRQCVLDQTKEARNVDLRIARILGPGPSLRPADASQKHCVLHGCHPHLDRKSVV